MHASASNPLSAALVSIRPVACYLMFFSLVSNIFSLAIPLYSLQVLDRVLGSGSMETLFWLTALTLVLMGVTSVVQLARSNVMQRVHLWLDQLLQDVLVKRTIQLSAVAASGTQPSTQMMRDFTTIKSFLTGNFATVLLDAPWAAFYFLAVMLIHPLIGAVTLAGSVVLMLMAWVNERAMRHPLMRANTLSVKAMQSLESAARNAEVIDAMGMTEAVATRMRHKNEAAAHWQHVANRRSAMIQAVSRYARIVLQIAVTGVGAWLAVHQQITSGAIIASSILANKAMAPFEHIVGMWKTIGDARIALHRLTAALNLFPVAEEKIMLPEPMGDIAVEKLTYGIPDRLLIKGVDFSLSAGESLCIIGPSAAGKSTLVRLLAGILQPLSGTVRLDGAEMKHWRDNQALEHIGYLPQDVELFEGTVRDNIARMRENPDDGMVIAAAQMAQVHQMILQLPQGYETEIGPRGTNLSQGQRQRIGLARAFFGSPRLVVLDEPNANLDQEGEQALLATLMRARERKITTVTVTHHMGVLSVADKLLLINQGAAMRFGPTQEVLQQLAQRHVQQPLQKSA